mmetsp:Transcript_23850/g.68504  ORF Transcript_23850/g.68504 Transcript_23850/m.68504 type:complete len:211 (+) Transcript_23850:526-1158(+)
MPMPPTMPSMVFVPSLEEDVVPPARQSVASLLVPWRGRSLTSTMASKFSHMCPRFRTLKLPMSIILLLPWRRSIPTLFAVRMRLRPRKCSNGSTRFARAATPLGELLLAWLGTSQLVLVRQCLISSRQTLPRPACPSPPPRDSSLAMALLVLSLQERITTTNSTLIPRLGPPEPEQTDLEASRAVLAMERTLLFMLHSNQLLLLDRHRTP